MKNDTLQAYLNDHLTGATGAVRLLGRCQSLYAEVHAEGALGPFFARLLAEVERDRDVLRALIARTEGTETLAKKVAGWFAEKASRAKLRAGRGRAGGGLGLLEALEALLLGVEGKRALWAALEAAVANEPEDWFSDVDFAVLKRRAERQHAQIEAHRVAVARGVLSAPATGAATRPPPPPAAGGAHEDAPH